MISYSLSFFVHAFLPKFTVALRINSPGDIQEAINSFDDKILKCLEVIIGSSIDDNTRLRIALSISKGGLGIPLATYYALPAYLGAYCKTLHLQARILHEDAESLSPYISLSLSFIPYRHPINKHQSFLYAFAALRPISI